MHGHGRHCTPRSYIQKVFHIMFPQPKPFPFWHVVSQWNGLSFITGKTLTSPASVTLSCLNNHRERKPSLWYKLTNLSRISQGSILNFLQNQLRVSTQTWRKIALIYSVGTLEQRITRRKSIWAAMIFFFFFFFFSFSISSHPQLDSKQPPPLLHKPVASYAEHTFSLSDAAVEIESDMNVEVGAFQIQGDFTLNDGSVSSTTCAHTHTHTHKHKWRRERKGGKEMKEWKRGDRKKERGDRDK